MSVITCSSNGDWQCSREYGIVVSSRSSSTSSNVFAINLRSTMFIPSRVRLERSCATRYLHALLWDRILMEFWTTSFIRRPHGQMACPQLSLVEKTLKTGMRQMDKLGFRTGKGFFPFCSRYRSIKLTLKLLYDRQKIIDFVTNYRYISWNISQFSFFLFLCTDAPAANPLNGLLCSASQPSSVPRYTLADSL